MPLTDCRDLQEHGCEYFRADVRGGLEAGIRETSRRGRLRGGFPERAQGN